jgi:hypothetical protein
MQEEGSASGADEWESVCLLYGVLSRHLTARGNGTRGSRLATDAHHFPARGSSCGTSGHQRKAVCVKHLVGAASVVCPCIAVNRAVPGSV